MSSITGRREARLPWTEERSPSQAAVEEPGWASESLDLPDLASLRLLCLIARSGSIGSAGKLLGLTQPSASLRLRELERRIGVALVERSSRGCTLTVEGSRVVEDAEVLLTAAEKFSCSTNLLRGATQRKLRIASSCVVAEFLIPKWITQLRDTCPDVRISLTMCNSVAVARELERYTVDLGFIEGPDTPVGLSEIPVGRDQLRAVVGIGHPLFAVPRISVDEFVHSRLIARELGSGARDTLETALDDLGLSHPSDILELGSTSMIRSAVAQGAGIGILSDLAVAEALSGGVLWAVDIDGLHMPRTLRGVFRDDARLSPPARELLRLATIRNTGT